MLTSSRPVNGSGMASVTHVGPNGSSATHDVPEGRSVMQGAVDHGIAGPIAECGGNAVCATCHVYVEARFSDLLPPVAAHEDALLEGTSAERRPASRLS